LAIKTNAIPTNMHKVAAANVSNIMGTVYQFVT
jgi:hypothetical protein